MIYGFYCETCRMSWGGYWVPKATTGASLWCQCGRKLVGHVIAEDTYEMPPANDPKPTEG